MPFGSVFQRLVDKQDIAVKGPPPSRDWLASARDAIGVRFAEMTGHRLQVVPVNADGEVAWDGRGRVGELTHCAGVCSERERHAGWVAHLEELKRSASTHWHECEHGMKCAVAPLIVDGRCVGACRLVCESTTEPRMFEQHVRLLDCLVVDYALRNGVDMSGGVPERIESRASDAAAPVARPDDVIAPIPPESHPAVRAAAEHIEQNLSDPALTVGGIAETLGMNSTYLGHLFVKEVGLPMHRHIIRLRMQMAKRLLMTTDWQVKRIAYAIGHRNADWFSHVFRRETGITPREYRRAARAAEEDEPSRGSS